MSNPINNLCPRCGKSRIIAKTWQENIKTYMGTSVITHTIMVCPDPSCQQKVDADIAANKERVQNLIKAKEERDEASKLARTNKVK